MKNHKKRNKKEQINKIAPTSIDERILYYI